MPFLDEIQETTSGTSNYKPRNNRIKDDLSDSSVSYYKKSRKTLNKNCRIDKDFK